MMIGTVMGRGRVNQVPESSVNEQRMREVIKEGFNRATRKMDGKV
jgi:hypothetical protein